MFCTRLDGKAIVIPVLFTGRTTEKILPIEGWVLILSTAGNGSTISTKAGYSTYWVVLDDHWKGSREPCYWRSTEAIVDDRRGRPSKKIAGRDLPKRADQNHDIDPGLQP
jgi:hypothetical protein